MSSALKDYEDEFVSGAESIRSGLTALTDSFGGGPKNVKTMSSITDRKARCAALLQTLHSLRQVLSDMEVEIADLPTTQMQVEARARLTGYRAAAKRLDREVDAMRKRCESIAERRPVLANSKNDSEESDNDVHSAVAAVTAKARDSTAVLNEAERLVSATHETADSTINEVLAQRETIRRVGQTAVEMDQELTQAHRQLRRMQRTLVKHRLVLLGMIILVFAAVVTVVYLKLRRR